MIDTTQLTQLISAFRVETEKESISPETVGALLQNITDIIANASTDAELQIFENWKAILSQLNLVESVEQGVDNIEHVNIAMALRDLANGGRTGRNFAIAPATAQRAGVMTAAQAQMLASLNDAVSALELAFVHIGNKNAEQDEKLAAIQQGSTVVTDMLQGADSTTKINLTIKKKDMVTGDEFTNTNSRQIAAATNQKAGVMTKAHVLALEKAAQDISYLRIHTDLLREPQIYVTSVEPRPPQKENVYIGIEYSDIIVGERIEAGDDIEIPGATAQQAGVMTTKHVKRLEDAERDIYNLKKQNAEKGTSMYHISAEVNNEGGNHLVIKGAKQLLALGYYPYLFRLSKKRNRYAYDGLHGPLHKGWNRVGNGKETIQIANDGSVSISITALKHTGINIENEEEPYKMSASWFVNDRVKEGYRLASFGKTRIPITYMDNNNEVRAKKVKLPFGIAFSKMNTGPREKFDMGSLVTNIAKFHVSTDPKEHGTRYSWIFER